MKPAKGGTTHDSAYERAHSLRDLAASRCGRRVTAGVSGREQKTHLPYDDGWGVSRYFAWL